MTGHAIGMFLHIAGGLGMSAALGLEWAGLWQIRVSLLPEQVRAWLGIFKAASRLLFVSMLVNVLTGMYMMVTEWGPVSWLIVSLGSIVLMIVLARALTGPRMAAIGQALVSEKRPTSQTFHNLASHPLLWISIQTRVAILLSILLLMLTQPKWGGALITVGVAIIIGIVSALPQLRRERAQKGLAH